MAKTKTSTKKPVLLVHLQNNGTEGEPYYDAWVDRPRYGRYDILEGVCNQFETFTGIKLPPGQTQVFRMSLTKQRAIVKK